MSEFERATRAATVRATDRATYTATRAATVRATDRATYTATYDATDRATDRAAATRDATSMALNASLDYS